MTIHQAYKQLLFQLYEMYDDREAANIADLVLENITGFKKVDRLINKQFPLNEDQLRMMEDYTTELLQHRPVQYVLHEAWFAGMKLYVDENVLIPRPETEELVNWVAETVKRRPARAARLLDIGTGSGCIAIALKKQFPSMAIQAVDISEGALQVAQKNAATHLSPIDFHHLDILSKESSKTLGKFDLIVSNPPYVTKGEASSMKKNVLQNEPHIALFVDDEDALKFYRAITEFACAHLNNNGTLFFEINEAMGEQVSEFLAHEGFSDVELKNDLQNKERMVKATYHS